MDEQLGDVDDAGDKENKETFGDEEEKDLPQNGEPEVDVGEHSQCQEETVAKEDDLDVQHPETGGPIFYAFM